MNDAMGRLTAALADRYRVERQLGEGGMATVYLADDLRHGRKVALKLLKPELAAVVGADRFLAEIRTTANLQHPHILPLHDSGNVDGLLFYVMPRVEGESLRERLDREHQLPVQEAVRIAMNVAEALDYAHRHGVIHRDIKPANVLLQDGKPVISDFGIALAVSSGGAGRLTETGLSLGTPHYMSPEQATGDATVGQATDIWALGCVLYEMLVGEPPYTGSTPQAVLGKIITADAASAIEARRSVAANVDAAIRKALEKVPADRFGSANEFVQALGDPGFRHGPGAQDRAAPARRNTTLVTGALAVATVILLGTTLWGLVRAPVPAPVVRFELTLPEGIVPSSGSGVGLALSPDGSTVVFVATGPGGIQLWQRALDELGPAPIPGTAEARNPRFSADGTAVAFTADGSLRRVSLTGAPPLTLVADSVPDGGGGLAWGTDGWLYFRKFGVGIWRVSENGGDAEEVTTPTSPENGHVWVEALPDGRGLLFTRDVSGPTDDEIAVLDLETREIRTLLQGAMARYARSGHIVYASGEGTLLAAPFDVERLEVTGPARTLLEGVEVGAGSASAFAMSETGVMLYRPGGVDGQPVWIARDGSEEVLDPEVVGAFGNPSVSPDGRKVALTRNEAGGRQDIWIYDVDQGAFTPLTFGGENEVHPFWSPDGREVGFSSGHALYARAADLSAEARLLFADGDSAAALFAGQWTPDGARLVYERDVGPNFDVYHVAAHPDSTPVAFVDTDFQEEAPALSPDGRWLAYVSNESGRDQVYVRPFPASGGRSAVSLDGGDSPVWASDREIVYQASGGAYVAATLRASPIFAVERRVEIASWQGFVVASGSAQYDASRIDGRLLAMRQSSPSLGAGRDVIVLNWFEELKRLAPN